MGKIGLVEVVGQQAAKTPHRPAAGSDVWIAIDISRTKLVYCLRWDGGEQRRLSTPMGLEHVRALVEQYRDCCLHVAYEACGFGYEKCGPGSLRATLLQCAWAAVRRGTYSELIAVFERLSPRIGRKRAIVAVARCLAIKLRQRWLAVVHPELSIDSAV